MFKNKKLLLLLLPMVLILSGCSQAAITTDPSGIWATIMYWFAVVIVYLSDLVGNNIASGIIISAIIIRVVSIPVYRKQLKSSESMNAIQPEIQKINKKYANNNSPEGKAKKQTELSALYQRNNINPLSSCIPLLIQMPILLLYYGALRGILVNGSPEPAQGLLDIIAKFGFDDINLVFLGIDLAVPSLLFAIIAAIATYISTELSTLGRHKSPDPSALERQMNLFKYAIPVMIFVFAIKTPGSIALYWAVGNIFSVFQTLYFRRTHITNHMIMKREEQKNKNLNKKN